MNGLKADVNMSGNVGIESHVNTNSMCHNINTTDSVLQNSAIQNTMNVDSGINDSKMQPIQQHSKTSQDAIRSTNNSNTCDTSANKTQLNPHNDTSEAIPTHLTIQIENRKFCLSLEKLDFICRQKIVGIFAQRQYTLEELLTLFVTTLRDQSAAEQELMRIVHILKS
ncbi:hypothetical protein [Helicobacter trogontum]|uniref:Uncharacterized protein n=1 Tax=Helicobacter trogontum TaxID=50960 RepID=A0ABQ0D3P2_9HELI|nr:hypothetical protein [Helicobacter trogontum]MDY5186224.1 hypothetical protein [Helicobacter trogontum]